MMTFIKLFLFLLVFCGETSATGWFTCDFSNCTSANESVLCEGNCKFTDGTQAVCKGNLSDTLGCKKINSTSYNKTGGAVLRTVAECFSWGETTAWFYLALRTVVKECLVAKGVADNSLKRDMLRSWFQRALDSGVLCFFITCPSFVVSIASIFLNIPDDIVSIVSGAFPAIAGGAQLVYDLIKIARWGYYKCHPLKKKEREIEEGKRFLDIAKGILDDDNSSLKRKDKDHLLVEVKDVLSEGFSYCLGKDIRRELEIYSQYLDDFDLEFKDLDLSDDGKVEQLRQIREVNNKDLSCSEIEVQKSSNSDNSEQNSNFLKENVGDEV